MRGIIGNFSRLLCNDGFSIVNTAGARELEVKISELANRIARAKSRKVEKDISYQTLSETYGNIRKGTAEWDEALKRLDRLAETVASKTEGNSSANTGGSAQSSAPVAGLASKLQALLTGYQCLVSGAIKDFSLYSAERAAAIRAMDQILKGLKLVKAAE